MKKSVYFLFFLFISLSCNSLQEGAPPNLIPSDKMAQILLEIHRTEAEVARMSFNSYDSAKVAYNYLHEKLLKKYNCDTAQYRLSYEFYASHPDQFVKIYNILDEKATKMAQVEPEEVEK